MNAPKFEITKGGEPIFGIKPGKNFFEKNGIYSYYLSMYIGPFLRKFGFKPEDSNWDEQYLVFQSLLLNSGYYNDFDEKVLQEKGFEIVGKKQIQVKLFQENIVGLTEISGDNFDIQEYLQKAYSGEYYFGFIPGEKNSNFVIFAKKVKVEVDFTSGLQKVVDVSTLGIDECLAMIDFKNLPPEIRDLNL